MTVLIDPPRWPAHGRLWSHLVSDASLDELHTFCRSFGIPERGFDHDHYDVPGERYPALVAVGAVPVDSRELLRRLTAAGLRRPRRDRRRGRADTPAPTPIGPTPIGPTPTAPTPIAPTPTAPTPPSAESPTRPTVPPTMPPTVPQTVPPTVPPTMPPTGSTALPGDASIAAVHWDDAAVTALRHAQQQEIQAVYRAAGQVDQEPGVVPTAADVTVTVLATIAGEPVACGALRRLDQHCGEVKRMYVVPGWRGRGLARAVLTDLEGRARRYGWSVLRLETGQLLDDAIALYTRAGFARIERFGHYVGNSNSVCFEKRLVPTAL